MNCESHPVARARKRIAACLAILGLMLPPLLSAAAFPKIDFDLPAGPAQQTLKQFAVQSGLEVLFVTEIAAGVTTNTVKGELAPKDAMDRLLAGTTLVASEDAKTRAMKIVRGTDPNASWAAPATPKRPPKSKPGP